MKKKKKTRRGGRARHPMLDQDAKMMSKTQDEKVYAHIKCFKCKDMGHFASKCTTKLDKKIQAKEKRQGNEKQHMSKEEKAQSKRVCYSCRKRGHMANSCPLGNNSKPIQLLIIICLERMAMVPHWLQLQNILLLILKQCPSMLLLT